MKNYKAIIFDLDGTLINTDLYVVLNFLRVIEKYSKNPIPDLKELVYLSGPPLKDTLLKYCPEELYDDALKDFLSWSKDNCNKYSKLYDNEIETLIELRKRGYKLGVVTNKNTYAVNNVFKYFDFFKYFDAVYPLEKCGEPKPNPRGLIECAKELDCSIEDSIYIGDSIADMEAGVNANMDIAYIKLGLKEYKSDIKPNMTIASFTQMLKLFK